MKSVKQRVSDFYEYAEYGVLSVVSFCYVYSIAQFGTAGLA